MILRKIRSEIVAEIVDNVRVRDCSGILFLSPFRRKKKDTAKSPETPKFLKKNFAHLNSKSIVIIWWNIYCAELLTIVKKGGNYVTFDYKVGLIGIRLNLPSRKIFF